MLGSRTAEHTLASWRGELCSSLKRLSILHGELEPAGSHPAFVTQRQELLLETL